MAQLLQTFNAHDYDPTQGNPPLPVGRHPVIIVDSEVKATKGNDGGFLEFTLKIIDGPSQNQTGPYRLNLYSSSQKAAEIAHRQMSAVCHAIGVFNVTDTRAMHEKPFMVDVALQPGEEAAAKGYTQVTKIYDINGNEPGKKGGQQQQQHQPQHDPYREQMAQSQQGPGGQSHQPMGGGQQQQASGGWSQPQQQSQPQGGNAWGGGQQQQPAQQQPQSQGNPGWSQPQQQPAQQQPSAPGGWQQAQQANGGNPGWGQRN